MLKTDRVFNPSKFFLLVHVWSRHEIMTHVVGFPHAPTSEEGIPFIMVVRAREPHHNLHPGNGQGRGQQAGNKPKNARNVAVRCHIAVLPNFDSNSEPEAS